MVVKEVVVPTTVAVLLVVRKQKNVEAAALASVPAATPSKWSMEEWEISSVDDLMALTPLTFWEVLLRDVNLISCRRWDPLRVRLPLMLLSWT